MIQFFILEECENVDNKQDFYFYEGLDTLSLKRDDVKLISQCFLYNDDYLNGWRAYNQKCWMNKKYTKISYQKWVNELIPLMKSQKSYLFDGLFFNKEKCKHFIHKESDFILELSRELMDKGINHISCFDAIYVGYREVERTLSAFSEISHKKFGRSINVDFDNGILNELSKKNF